MGGWMDLGKVLEGAPYSTLSATASQGDSLTRQLRTVAEFSKAAVN